MHQVTEIRVAKPYSCLSAHYNLVQRLHGLHFLIKTVTLLLIFRIFVTSPKRLPQRSLRDTCSVCWHFPMLQDVERTHFYRRAIATGVYQGAHVVDIGSGTGCITCKKVKAVAECAAEIIAANWMPDICRINTVPLLSNKLEYRGRAIARFRRCNCF